MAAGSIATGVPVHCYCEDWIAVRIRFGFPSKCFDGIQVRANAGCAVARESVAGKSYAQQDCFCLESGDFFWHPEPSESR